MVRYVAGVILLGLLCCEALGQVESLHLSLPVYRLTVDPAHLADLEQNPWTDETYQATLSVDEVTAYPCRVRFRGTSTRTLPKKSWRIRLEDDDLFGSETINLNAEYRDASLMRNHLAMQLFDFLGFPASRTEHVSLFVNDEYAGVYVQVQRIDDAYLNEHGLPAGDLYQPVNQGGTLSPLLYADHYPLVWAAKRGTEADFTDLQALTGKLTYWDRAEFEAGVENLLDVENTLMYYAVQFAIVGQDNFIKNYYLYRHPDDEYYAFLPWDMDGTFGDDWEGIWTPHMIEYDRYGEIRSVPFQRLMEYEPWQLAFDQKIRQVTNGGFDRVLEEVRQTYEKIKNDVYQDSGKSTTNEGFDNAINRLETFLLERQAFMRQLAPYARIPVSDMNVSETRTSGEKRTVTFRVRTETPRYFRVVYVPDLAVGVMGDPYTEEALTLYDDGRHDDLEAGDGVYGNRLDLDSIDSDVVPFMFVGSRTYYPAQGLRLINTTPNVHLALVPNHTGADAFREVQFEQVMLWSGAITVPIVNHGENPVDLSNTIFQAGPSHQRIQIPPGEVLHPGERLFISSSPIVTESRYPGVTVVGGLFFDVAADDSLYLRSSTLNPLVTALAGSPDVVTETLVINEVNYHSSPLMNSEDWVELYNAGDSIVDLSGWTVKDDNDNHAFTFPVATMLEPNGYVVVSRDTAALRRFLPDTVHPYGDLDFGFDSGGDQVRLVNAFGDVVDWLSYDNESPWPAAANGEGATMQRIDPFQPGDIFSNWKASRFNGGTPGRSNSSEDGPKGIPVEDTAMLYSYPNPFAATTTFVYGLETAGELSLVVYDALGRRVDVLADQFHEAGRYTLEWPGESLASGVYYTMLLVDGSHVKSWTLVLRR